MNNNNSLNQFSSPAKKQKKSPYSKNFLEAFKDQAKSATVGVGQAAMEQLAGQNLQQNPQEQQQKPNFNFAEYLRLREKQVRQQERRLAEKQRSAEVTIFHYREKQAQEQIKEIKTEIKSLTVHTGKLSTELREAEKAVFGQIPDLKSGIYYLSFFERIKRLVKLAKKKITESQTWLQAFSARKQARSFYWGQVKKSGTKFMLSQERAVATQAG